MQYIIFGFSFETERLINILGIDNVIGIIDSVAMNVGKKVLGIPVELMTRKTKIPKDAVVISTASDNFEASVVLEKFKIQEYFMFDDISKYLEESSDIQDVLERYENSIEFWKKKAEYHRFVQERFKQQLDYLMKQTSPYNLLPSKGYLRRTQLNYLEYALESFDELKDLNIHPFASFGTLLGAIRHKGFIPWDDDFDMGIIRGEYQSIIDYYEDKGKYYLFDGLYPELYGWIDRVIKDNANETVLIAYADQIQLTKGSSVIDRVFVDLFPYDYYSDDYTFSEMKEEIANNVKVVKDPNTTFKKRVEYITERREENRRKGITCDDSSKLFFGIDSYEMYYKDSYSDFIPKEVIFPLREMEFEGHMLYVPNKPEEYMKIQYRNFKEYPSDVGVSKHNHWFKFRIDNYFNVELIANSADEVKKLEPTYIDLRKNGINALYYISAVSEQEIINSIDEIEAEYHRDFNENCDICVMSQECEDGILVDDKKKRYFDVTTDEKEILALIKEIKIMAAKEGKAK